MMFVDAATIMYECYLPLAEKLNIPVIGTISTRSWKHAEWTLGNPYPPSTVPYEMGLYRSDHMTFLQRLSNTYDSVFDYFYYHIQISDRLKKHQRRYFPNSPSRPRKRPSLLFVNGHNVLLPRPLLPNIIHVGGIHLTSSNVLLPVSIRIGQV